MTTYKTGGMADAGLAILIGLLVGLFMAAVVKSGNAKTPEQPKKAETVQTEQKPAEPTPKAEAKPETKPAETKQDCTFWRTMYFANIGKSMQAYYYIQWQNCENQ
jgi:hypothetical protein